MEDPLPSCTRHVHLEYIYRPFHKHIRIHIRIHIRNELQSTFHMWCVFANIYEEMYVNPALSEAQPAR